MISLEKFQILTPLQKLPKNLGNFGQINFITLISCENCIEV